MTMHTSVSLDLNDPISKLFLFICYVIRQEYGRVVELQEGKQMFI